jgi:hypothetical protein
MKTQGHSAAVSWNMNLPRDGRNTLLQYRGLGATALIYMTPVTCV